MSFMSFANRFSNTFFHIWFKKKSHHLIQFFRTRIYTTSFYHSNKSRHSSSILLVKSNTKKLFHLTNFFRTWVYTTSRFQLNIRRLSTFKKFKSKSSKQKLLIKISSISSSFWLFANYSIWILTMKKHFYYRCRLWKILIKFALHQFANDILQSF